MLVKSKGVFMDNNKQNRRSRYIKRLNVTPTFWIALIAVLVIVIVALIFAEPFTNITTKIRDAIAYGGGWFYLLTVMVLIMACFILVVSPVGRIRLGDRDSKPEYSTGSWIAMLFAAGMGISLVFYGAAEPLSHFAVSAPEAALYTREALLDAFKYSFFHYGIHGWAVYSIVALAIAYFQFRKKESFLLSASLKPIFGKAVDGPFGKIVDSITIFATVIGVATSLGFGAIQINSGMGKIFGIPVNFLIQVIIIIVATCLFIGSAVSGLDKGVKRLSNFNMIIAALLIITAFIVGPGIKMLNTFTETLGAYFQDFVRMSTLTGMTDPAQRQWISEWTVFFWAWWLAWSPFVGVFIARISKGRTIREFVGCVLLIPSLFSFLWFSVFGVLSTELAGVDPGLAQQPLESILFSTFAHYPLALPMSIAAILLLIVFFVTSADSATFVLAMQSEGGNLNPSTPVKIIWGVLVSTIAIVLLRAGGLSALQNVLIITALPFSILLLLITASLVKELNYERRKMGLFLKARRHPEKDAPFRSYEKENK